MQNLYKKYLQTEEWKTKADACKELANYKCNRCDNTTNLHAHHKTYDRVGEELQEDLECLCSECHDNEHNKPELRKSRGIKGGFSMVYKSYDEVLSKCVKSNLDYKIILAIRNKFTYKRVEVVISFTTLAQKMNTSKQKVTKLIKELVEEGLLLRIDKGTYRLNPFMYIPYRADGEELQQEWNQLITKDN